MNIFRFIQQGTDEEDAGKLLGGITFGFFSITMVLILGYFFPQLKWHFETVCIINRLPDTWFTLCLVYGVGMVSSSIIVALTLNFIGAIGLFITGFLIWGSAMFIIIFGFKITFIMIALTAVLFFYKNMVTLFIVGLAFAISLDNASPVKLKEVETSTILYADCKETTWSIILFYSKASASCLIYDMDGDEDNQYYFKGTYAQAQNYATQILKRQDNKYADRFYKPENTIIQAWIVPVKLAKKYGDLNMLQMMKNHDNLKN